MVRGKPAEVRNLGFAHQLNSCGPPAITGVLLRFSSSLCFRCGKTGAALGIGDSWADEQHPVETRLAGEGRPDVRVGCCIPGPPIGFWGPTEAPNIRQAPGVLTHLLVDGFDLLIADVQVTTEQGGSYRRCTRHSGRRLTHCLLEVAQALRQLPLPLHRVIFGTFEMRCGEEESPGLGLLFELHGNRQQLPAHLCAGERHSHRLSKLHQPLAVQKYSNVVRQRWIFRDQDLILRAQGLWGCK
mmetsp:Transcript_14582/g.34681  ORF Transcript_14582/g.34681 Transcript_14582/m.34681 type:complete len:242 (-) Transcript_14582:271-996(-)